MEEEKGSNEKLKREKELTENGNMADGKKRGRKPIKKRRKKPLADFEKEMEKAVKKLKKFGW